MNLLDNLPDGLSYQFPRWPSALSRPYTSFQSVEKHNDTTKLVLDNRSQPQRPDSASSTSKRIFEYHVRIPTGSGPGSPPPNTPFGLDLKPSRIPTRSMNSRRCRSIPVRIKATSLSIAVSKNKEGLTAQNFPRQTYEQRIVTRERKRKKQQAQFLAEKYAEAETWFQLKRSLTELKRLATTQEIQIDSSTSFFNCDTEALKQVIDNADEKRVSIYQSESVISSSVVSSSVVSSNDSNRTSISRAQSLISRPQTTKIYPKLVYEPLMIATKPIHPLLLPNPHPPSRKSRIKAPISPSRPTSTPLTEEKRARLLPSDLSNESNPSNSISPTPPMVKFEREVPPRKASTASQLTSNIKLKHQIPRCHSATDIKPPPSIMKQSLRFLLICDEEHRIESWYHQYPFIHGDDLLNSFQSKSSQQKAIISAYFIDDFQSSKTSLQGKAFHIHNDWKKYDLILISNSIYNEIMIHLQTNINLIKSSGKFIQIHQLTHEEDLRKQIKNICKQKHF